jgi:alpha-glucosidase (family GH31 glycosyl hydrolase)
LVSPVVEAGKTTQEVYFPKDNMWFNFYTDEKIEGGQTKTLSLKENSIPTYVRAGAFIPTTEVKESTKTYNPNRITLHYYHDESVLESEREVYNDDGKTVNAIEKGQYEILEFEAEKEGRWLEIEFEAELGSNYDFRNKEMTLVIHNIEKMPKRIKDNTAKVNGTYSKKNKTLTLNINWNTKEEKEIRIKLKK